MRTIYLVVGEVGSYDDHMTENVRAYASRVAADAEADRLNTLTEEAQAAYKQGNYTLAREKHQEAGKWGWINRDERPDYSVETINLVED